MTQVSIKVDPGSGSAVDFSQTTGGNYRQAVTIGDPTTDANLAPVGANGLAVDVKAGTIQAQQSGAWNVNGTVAATQSGNWNVGITGSVSVGNSISGTVGISAGTAFIGEVSVGNDTSTVFNGTTAITPSFGTLSFSTMGNNTAIPQTVGKIIRVLAMTFTASTACSVYMTDGAGGTPIFASSSNGAAIASSGGFVLPYNPIGWLQTSSGGTLTFNLSTTSSVGGVVTYLKI